MRNRILLALLALGSIVLAGWLLTHSYLSIDTANTSGSGEISYSLARQGEASKTHRTESASIKKLVRKGTYAVTVKQGETSYFSQADAKGLLRTTAVSAELAAESERTFVGDNPGPCMYYVVGRLYSGSCQGRFSDIKLHVPATPSLPTYTDNVAVTNIFGNSSGLAHTVSGWIMLVQQSAAESGADGYYLYSVGAGFAGGTRIRAADLDPNKTYSIKPYKEGYVVYDPALTSVFYYPSIAARPQKIAVGKPSNARFVPSTVSVQREAITIIYSAPVNGDLPPSGSGIPAQSSGNGTKDSQVAVIRGGSQQRFNFGTTIRRAAACGTGKLCLVNDSGLAVYDITGQKAEYMYAIPGVTDLEETGNGLLAVTASGVLSLDIDNRKGYIDYSFGSYKNCGLQPDTGSNYVLCILNDKGKRQALYINQLTKNSDSIDKKAAQLMKAPSISDVSVNGKFIYIVPEYGDLVYDPVLKINRTDPVRLAKVNQEISQVVAQSGVDRSRYTVVSTGFSQ